MRKLPNPKSEIRNRANIQNLELRNLQRAVAVNVPLLRQMVQAFLAELPGAAEFNVAIHLVDTSEITRLNETFLHHKGSTDVVTFDYGGERGFPALHGEIFVCLDEAFRQCRRFHTTWQSELVRYIIHGVLHLCGFDDHRFAQRRRMKRVESGFLRRLARDFDFKQLGPGTKRTRVKTPFK